MGGCAGKTKSKSYEPKSDSTKKPKSRKKGFISRIFFVFFFMYLYVTLDDRVKTKPSPSEVFSFEIKNRFCFETHFSQ